MAAAPVVAGCSSPPDAGDDFLVGVNYPWLNYGHDFGTTAWGHDGASSVVSRPVIDADFADLARRGVDAVRWFVFGDGRASPEFGPDGRAGGLDDRFFPDFDAALSLADKHSVDLVPVLLDFHLADTAREVNGVQLGGRRSLVVDAEARQAFVDRVVGPLLDRYGTSRRILAWDIISEPEGAMDVPEGRWVDDPVPAEAMQSFVGEIARFIHANASQPVTVGSASRDSLRHWRNTGLDLYQFHYYDAMEARSPLDHPYRDLGLDKPCLVGEFPTAATSRAAGEFLDVIARNGYAGAFAWSYRAGDAASAFETAGPAIEAWSRPGAGAVGGTGRGR